MKKSGHHIAEVGVLFCIAIIFLSGPEGWLMGGITVLLAIGLLWLIGYTTNSIITKKENKQKVTQEEAAYTEEIQNKIEQIKNEHWIDDDANERISRAYELNKTINDYKNKKENIVYARDKKFYQSMKRYQKLNAKDLDFYEAEIPKLETEYESIRHIKIRETASFKKLRDALEKLLGSEHIEGQVDIKKVFVNNINIPCLCFDYAPISIDTGTFKFFVFAQYILMFNKDDEFICVIKRTAFSAKLEVEEKEVCISTVTYSDSDIVQKEHNYSVWKYARVDGGPDMRYHNNYKIKHTYMKDYVRVNKLTVSIAEIQFVFEVSSGENCKTFIKAINNLK